jgi:hypothetical protein
MASATPHTITLKGDPQGREALAGGAIVPGMLLAKTTTGTVVAHNVAKGQASAMFAREGDIFGMGIDEAYATGETVLYSEYRKGDMVYAFLEAGADVAIGALLESNGAGALQPRTPFSQGAADPFTVVTEGHAIARAMEAVDNDPGTGGAAVRIRVEVL